MPEENSQKKIRLRRVMQNCNALPRTDGALHRTGGVPDRAGGVPERNGGALKRTGGAPDMAGGAIEKSRHVLQLAAAHTAGPLIFAHA